MRCPYCGSLESRVTDSRSAQGGIRRRRECLDCHRRFTTYEQVRATSLMVTKRDTRREEFDREKLASGIRKACAKRSVSANTIEKLVEAIEDEFQGQGEVAANQIGEAVMEQLRSLDRVAYIRYASVYRDFQDIDSFEQAVKDLREGGGTQLTFSHIAPGAPERHWQARERKEQPGAGDSSEPDAEATQTAEPDTDSPTEAAADPSEQSDSDC